MLNGHNGLAVVVWDKWSALVDDGLSISPVSLGSFFVIDDGRNLADAPVNGGLANCPQLSMHMLTNLEP